MFWYKTLIATGRGPQCKTRVDNNFKVSKATLDLERVVESQDDSVSVWVVVDGKHSLLANLNRNNSQVQIDTAFGKGQFVDFYLRAQYAASVHLIGYDIYDDDSSSHVSFDEKKNREKTDAKLNEFAKHDFSSFGQAPSFSQYNSNEYFGKNNDYFGLGNISNQASNLNPIDALAPTSPKVKKLINDPEQNKGPRTLSDGVVIEDISEGQGAMAEKNSKVSFTYKLSVASTGVISGSSSAEVILGKRNKSLACWNIGIPGMKVGGVRKITSSPENAYGSKGIPPFIDGGTDVVFEIQLNDCH